MAARIVSTMKLHAAHGKPFGVAIVAEGVLDCINPSSSELLSNCPRDELGRIRYSQIELDEVLLPL